MFIDWIAGGLVIAANVLIGRGDRFGWLLNLTAQIPLLYLNYKFHLWGLFPMSFFLMGVFVFNYLKWLKNDIRTQASGRRRERYNSSNEGFPRNPSSVEGPSGESCNNPPSAR